jgi:hypothetical protein
MVAVDGNGDAERHDSASGASSSSIFVGKNNMGRRDFAVKTVTTIWDSFSIQKSSSQVFVVAETDRHSTDDDIPLVPEVIVL